jgi:hypothetical protein
MDVISNETVFAANPQIRREIEFSPLDLFAGGHLPVGPLYGFHSAIDSDRFRLCLQIALAENPEIGVAVKIKEDGTHVMETGHGIELVIQRCDGPLFAGEAVADLPMEQFPLALAPLTSFELVDQKLPLLGFRLTYFDDGGCILGIRTTHSHMDGDALTQVILNLSAIYHGHPFQRPCCDRSVATRQLNGPGMQPSPAFPVSPGHTDTAFFFAENAAVQHESSRTLVSANALDRYVDALNRQGRIVSTSDVLNAAIWKAWSHTASAPDEAISRLYGVFNLRLLDGLGIPDIYQGNALLDRAAALTFAQVRTLPIADIALVYRQQIKPLKRDAVTVDITYLARLQREKSYGKDGTLNGFQRNLYFDLYNRCGLLINDTRLLQFDQVRFGEPACWFEQGQGHAHGFAAVSQHRDEIIIRYDGVGDETARFVAALKSVLAQYIS